MRRSISSALSLAAFAALAAGASAQSGDVTLGGSVPAITKPDGNAFRLTLADLDGDGRVEVFASMNRINIWRQLEGGQLTPMDSFTVPHTGTVALGDLDGDGAISLLSMMVTIRASEIVAPFVFGPAAELAPDGTSSPGLMEVADLDGDGHADLVANGGPGLRTWRGDGTGALLPSITSASVTTFRTELGDLDLDGKLDLIAVNSTGMVPLLGDGDGTFTELPTLPLTSGGSAEVALGHVNGDAFLDAVLATVTGVQLLLGDGAGGFAASVVTTDSTRAVDLGDTDGDGDDDLVAAGNSTAHVLLAQGNGFGASADFAAASLLRAVAVAHLDDGAPATVLVMGGLVTDFGLTVASCGADGLPAIEKRFAPGSDPLAAADVDGDGQDELVAWQQGSAQIAVHELPGDGTVGPAGPGTPVAGVPLALPLALDGDGLEDLLVLTDGGLKVEGQGWRSNGNGTFTTSPLFAVNCAYDELALADVDGDGDEDLLMNGAAPEWRPNLGNGTFGAAAAVLAPGLAAETGIALGDADEDGLADLFAAASGPSTDIELRKGLGDGSFAAPVALVVGHANSTAPRLVDLDGDGHLDILSYGLAPSGTLPGVATNILVMHGDGAGGFETASAYPVLGLLSLQPPWAADFRGDGRLDVLFRNELSQHPVLLPQAADGSFGAGRALAFLCDGAPFELILANVDGDGTPDLVSGNGFPPTDQVVRVGPVALGRGALDLGHGTVSIGVAGAPVLRGGGTLVPTQAAFLELRAAPANVPLLLILGLETAYLPVPPAPPVFWGQLVPAPQIVLGFTSDAQGGFTLEARWPADAPPGLAVYAQIWTTEPANGYPLASNALQFEGE